jgi:hypothetical protein
MIKADIWRTIGVSTNDNIGLFNNVTSIFYHRDLGKGAPHKQHGYAGLCEYKSIVKLIKNPTTLAMVIARLFFS